MTPPKTPTRIERITGLTYIEPTRVVGLVRADGYGRDARVGLLTAAQGRYFDRRWLPVHLVAPTPDTPGTASIVLPGDGIYEFAGLCGAEHGSAPEWAGYFQVQRGGVLLLSRDGAWYRLTAPPKGLR